MGGEKYQPVVMFCYNHWLKSSQQQWRHWWCRPVKVITTYQCIYYYHRTWQIHCPCGLPVPPVCNEVFRWMVMMAQHMTCFIVTTKKRLSQCLGTFNGPEKRHAIQRASDKTEYVFRQVWLKHGAVHILHGLPAIFPPAQQQQHKAAKGAMPVTQSCGTSTVLFCIWHR